jgi:hypothetical protein
MSEMCSRVRFQWSRAWRSALRTESSAEVGTNVSAWASLNIVGRSTLKNRSTSGV